MEALDLAIGEVDQLRRLIKKKDSSQVWAADERASVKATALAWFNAHRLATVSLSGSSHFIAADTDYSVLLKACDKATSRGKYDTVLKRLRGTLIALRADSAAQRATNAKVDTAPSFAPLISDGAMQTILLDRWNECVTCVAAGAPLSATVMMGGLLEALLLARVNRETDKDLIFKATAAPRDKHGKTKPLTEWGLKNYIDVAHELTWITVSAKDVGAVLRDYRNYVHPFKQLSHGMSLGPDDAALLWDVSKAITRQILKSAGP
jgi:hypothetical protein